MDICSACCPNIYDGYTETFQPLLQIPSKKGMYFLVFR